MGRAAIAVVRLSGPGAARILLAIGAGPPAPRRASLRRLVDPRDGTTIDHGIVLWFPGPGSFTGEDSAELQVHGGAAVTAALLDALCALGARPALPGEFARRAVLAGRMDLTQAEGIADLVDAETDLQRRQALRQSEGALGERYDAWTRTLTLLLAEAEAAIEFEDQDLPPGLDDRVALGMRSLAAELAAHLADGRRGERLRDGVQVAILGPPNVGKSSLLNRLAGREVAIVSAVPGTTRDIVEARLVLAGVPVTLRDTAGLRDSADPIEAEGVRRAHEAGEAADLVLELRDASAAERGGRHEAEAAGRAHSGARAEPHRVGRRIPVWSKADLACVPLTGLAISARTGAGMDVLLARLDSAVGRIAGLGEAPSITRQRHRHALEAAAEALDRGLYASLPELRAEDLRIALRAIGRITGRVDVEQVLDEVFRGFCIGK